MLQAVPDPFDSYGPPPAEDQIFSILPPLSVMANAPSSTASPLTSSTPELEGSSDGITSGKSSWVPATGTYFSESSAAWADAAPSASLPVSPARTVSPDINATYSFAPTSVSPSSASSGSNSSPRRHAHTAPPLLNHHHRKSESKLRSVLSVIDESNGQSHTNGGSHDSPPSDSASSGQTNGSGSGSGSRIWGALKIKLAQHASSPSLADDEMTPRNPTRARAQSPSSFSSKTPQAGRSRSPQSDDTVPITT